MGWKNARRASFKLLLRGQRCGTRKCPGVPVRIDLQWQGSLCAHFTLLCSVHELLRVPQLTDRAAVRIEWGSDNLRGVDQVCKLNDEELTVGQSAGSGKPVYLGRIRTGSR